MENCSTSPSRSTTSTMSQPAGQLEQKLRPLDDLTEYFMEYARERPDVVALTCIGVGFILGWKLKPW